MLPRTLAGGAPGSILKKVNYGIVRHTVATYIYYPALKSSVDLHHSSVISQCTVIEIYKGLVLPFLNTEVSFEMGFELQRDTCVAEWALVK